MKLTEDGKVRLRIIGHGTPKQWHDCSPEFAERVIAWCRDPKRKADIQVQLYYEGIQK